MVKLRAARRLVPLAVVLATLALAAWGLAAPTATIARPVNDLANVLSSSAEDAIAKAAVDHRRARGVQVAVLVVQTTGGEPIEDYAHRVAVAWGGGSRSRSDGVLYVLAVRDRRARLEVGYGLEAKIPDGRAKLILASVRTQLQAGDYDGAVAGVVNMVIAQTGGPQNAVRLTAARARTPAPPPAPRRASRSGGGSSFGGFGVFGLVIVIIVLVVFVWIAIGITAFARTRTGHGYGSGYGHGHHHHHHYHSGNDWLWGSSNTSSSSSSSSSDWGSSSSSSGWGGSDSSFGSSNDSSWSGGGGDFGGGGASDSW